MHGKVVNHNANTMANCGFMSRQQFPAIFVPILSNDKQSYQSSDNDYENKYP